ncbi:hypothetical protein MKX03_030565 [Papaver bracteatum]|nr:hypothetical protein MKX03_030565 [Papaver bracteatum]
MGDYLYRARAKYQIYVHILDLKRKYQDLLNDVPSVSRNYRLWETNYQISIANLRWESIKLPPLEEKFVHRTVNTEAKKKDEVFSAEMMPEFNQVLTPNSLPDATSDLTLDSDSILGSKHDLVNGLNGFLRSTSKIEDSVISMSDFTVSPTEEITSISTEVDDEDELELIPQFLFVEIEENDDRLDFEFLIPSFFFQEEEDLTAKVNFQTIAVLSYVKLQISKEFASGNNNVNSKNNFSLLPNYTRLLFDRGKDFKLIKRFCYLAGIYKFGYDAITSCSFALYVYSILMDECNGISVSELLSKNGYWSASWSEDSIDCIPPNEGVLSTT